MAIEIRNITRDLLPEVEKNGFDILIHLTVDHFNELKDLLELDVPSVLGRTTLDRFVKFAKDEGLDLKNAGVSAFKTKHKLGNTGILQGVIGPQTAETYFMELTDTGTPPAPGPKPPINAEGLALVKEFEGLHRRIPGDPNHVVAYLDPVQIPTIGYGSITGVKLGDKITVQRAEELLMEELKQKAAFVDQLVTVPLTDNQRSALVSFTFNLGQGNLKQSTLLKRVNAKRHAEAADEFLKWVNAGGHPLPGLVRRRQAERQLYLKP